MARYALVDRKTGTVTNVIEWDGAEVSKPAGEDVVLVTAAVADLNDLIVIGGAGGGAIGGWRPPEGCDAVASDTAAIGDRWDGKTFTCIAAEDAAASAEQRASDLKILAEWIKEDERFAAFTRYLGIEFPTDAQEGKG